MNNIGKKTFVKLYLLKNKVAKNTKVRKQAFLRFLKENNCYQQFFYYFNKSEANSHLFDERTINKLISAILVNNFKSFNEISLAFEWYDTVYGYDYWYELYKKWNTIIK